MSFLLRRAIQQPLSGGSFNLAENFNTTLYTGNGTTQDIIGNLDFVANEGLVWIKGRTLTSHNYLYDTLRGATFAIQSNRTDAEIVRTTALTSFNSNGFTLGGATGENNVVGTYAAWQVIKAQGFMDIVEYVGDSIAGRTVAIDLDDGTAVFGMSIVKGLDGSGYGWRVQHRTLTGTHYLELNSTGISFANTGMWNDTDGTTNALTVGGSIFVNQTGQRYISYNFAHNPSKGIFCGEFDAAGGNVFVDLSWPESIQYIMVKSYDSTGDWDILDTTRGITEELNPNLSNAETTVNKVIATTGGFTWVPSETKKYIFMAIRGL